MGLVLKPLTKKSEKLRVTEYVLKNVFLRLKIPRFYLINQHKTW